MASATPIDHGIASEQCDSSGEYFTFAMGTAFDVAALASGGSRDRVRSPGRLHPRSAGGDGRPR